jgi:penicillin-binding protein 1A
MKELDSPEPVRDVVSNMGIDKALIPSAPSIALGAVDLTVQQMTGAYTTFANNGVYNRPTYLLRIEDRTGRTIYTNIPEERQAISPQANYVMVHMLKNASVSNLTGIKGPVGGKTGTTNDQTDGWFMGITPNLVVGTWVGGEDRWVRFRSLALGQGGAMAKPYFREFIKAIQADSNIPWDTNRDFYRPKGSLGIELDCDAYNGSNEDILDEDNGNIEEEPFGTINNETDFG